MQLSEGFLEFFLVLVLSTQTWYPANMTSYLKSSKVQAYICTHWIAQRHSPHAWCIHCCVVGLPRRIRGQVLQPPLPCSLANKCADCQQWSEEDFTNYLGRVQIKINEISKLREAQKAVPPSPFPTPASVPGSGQSQASRTH